MRRFMVVALAAACVALSAAGGAFAEEKTKSAAEVAKDAEKAKDEETVKRSFAGIQFGVGLSLTLDSGSRDRVTSAQLVNGLVRIENEDNAIARVMLESHYFFTPDGCLFGLGTKRCMLLPSNEWGWGPFIAIQPGKDDIIDAIGAGVMLGFRRPGREDSFNIGIGAVVDPNSKILGDGISPNQPLPAGETEIRYKEKEQWGVVLITSYTF